jgi:hypothetical protein
MILNPQWQSLMIDSTENEEQTKTLLAYGTPQCVKKWLMIENANV